jgi:hypothetical protein
MSIHEVIITSIHDVIPLITAFASYAWPVTVLILASLFRKPIARRIEQIKRLKIGENVIEFGGALSDRLFFKGTDEAPAGQETVKQLSSPSGPQWGKVGNVFWLGGDLIATAQSTLRGAPKEIIRQALAQSYHHISELGLPDSPPAKEISLLQSELAILPETALDRAWRGAFAERIYGVTRMMDGLLRKQQPGYRANPQS